MPQKNEEEQQAQVNPNPNPNPAPSHDEVSSDPNVSDPANSNEEGGDEESVPLRVHIKERKRRKEEQAVRLSLQKQLDEAKAKAKREEDETKRYQAVTRGDLDSMRDQDKLEIIRTIKEDDWKRSNPNIAEFVDDNLDELLKKKPHIAMAIGNSLNRYEEAWDQLKGHGYTPSGSEKKSSSNEDKRSGNNAPLNPSSIPKGASVKESLSVMKMSDKEFNEYRKQRIKRR